MQIENRRSPWRKKIDRYIGIPLVFLVALIRKVFFFVFRRRKGPVGRILVIKLSALGDVVLILPALYRLRENFKNAEISFLAGRANSGFLQFSEFVDHVEVFSLRACFKILTGRPFDLVIDYDQWVRATALLSGLCRASQTSGFRSLRQMRHYAYDVQQPFYNKFHMAENFWNLTKCNLPVDDSSTFQKDKVEVRKIWGQKILSKAQSQAQALGQVHDEKPFVVIHPGCGDHGVQREWPIESWKELIGLLKTQNPDRHIFITGKGSREKWLGEQLIQTGTVSLVDKLDFPSLILTLSRAQLVFAPNTGIMHLADFLNDSVIVLGGPTDKVLWGPLWKGKNRESPLACAPCLTWGHDYGCSDAVCLRAITSKSVFEAL